MTTLSPDTVLSTTSSNANAPVTIKSDSPKTQTKPKKKAPRAAPRHNDECPIFLRKTYHMVDTCDPEVASWSEDGETFVVKNTEVFEKQIIPQFFKHSKFTSFVRQLNFYGFRKIKYCDTIKIDAKLEAETANFWRFRHEKFLRGRPDLLIEIKRSNGQSKSTTATEQSSQNNNKISAVEKPEDVLSLKGEVSTLKERIATMSKNIDDLTVLVQNMAVKSEPEEPSAPAVSDNKKRKKNEVKIEDCAMAGTMECRVDDNIDFRPGTIFPSLPSSRQQSAQSMASTDISDQEFVDDLFTAFEEDGIADISDPLNAEMDTSCPVAPPSAPLQAANVAVTPPAENSTDPVLMKKLSDALGLLPKDVQEMLVNRLVTAITNTDAMKSQVDAASTLSVASSSLSSSANMVECGEEIEKVPDETTSSSSHIPPMEAMPAQHQPIAVPLAAATLGALLAQYGSEMKKMNGVATKSIPVIPVHA
uniref:HSF-type DNA-binding domain-containing protein n=1 Tax=Helicotheca tamesis TaxID=374047 RepID=A0A7S2MPI4_9STRA